MKTIKINGVLYNTQHILSLKQKTISEEDYGEFETTITFTNGLIVKTSETLEEIEQELKGANNE